MKLHLLPSITLLPPPHETADDAQIIEDWARGLDWVKWLLSSVRARTEVLMVEEAAWDEFADGVLRETVGPALKSAWQAAQAGDLAGLIAADERLSAQLPPDLARRRTQAGAVLLKSTRHARYQAVLGRLREAVGQGEESQRHAAELLEELEAAMMQAAAELDFERAARLRDQIAADKMATKVLEDEILEALERIDTIKKALPTAETAVEAARKLLELAVHRQKAFSRRLDEMHHGQVENRLAKVLLRIGEEVGLKDSRGTFVPVKLSRGDLADLVGCRVETTIRVMTRWQREGVVETQREGLVIRDEGNLKETAAAVA
jgi:CRP-like cAMP-binding protein